MTSFIGQFDIFAKDKHTVHFEKITKKLSMYDMLRDKEPDQVRRYPFIYLSNQMFLYHILIAMYPETKISQFLAFQQQEPKIFTLTHYFASKVGAIKGAILIT